jgi:Zn-finger protein
MQPKDTVQTIYFKGYTNSQCEFFPCHKNVKKEFNCLFCYCPLIAYECPGNYLVYQDKHGNNRKDCSQCVIPHNGYETSWKIMQAHLENPKVWQGT